MVTQIDIYKKQELMLKVFDIKNKLIFDTSIDDKTKEYFDNIFSILADTITLIK